MARGCGLCAECRGGQVWGKVAFLTPGLILLFYTLVNLRELSEGPWGFLLLGLSLFYLVIGVPFLIGSIWDFAKAYGVEPCGREGVTSFWILDDLKAWASWTWSGPITLALLIGGVMFAWWAPGSGIPWVEKVWVWALGISGLLVGGRWLLSLFSSE